MASHHAFGFDKEIGNRNVEEVRRQFEMAGRKCAFSFESLVQSLSRYTDMPRQFCEWQSRSFSRDTQIMRHPVIDIDFNGFPNCTVELIRAQRALRHGKNKLLKMYKIG